MMHIVFVCTGNICRSPTAEGIAMARFAALATYGSAGTMTIGGNSPTSLAVTAAQELRVDISGLRSTPLKRANNPIPDLIYGMTQSHVSAIRLAFPELAERAKLLDPTGDIADPYGCDLETYRSVRDQIAASIDLRAGQWSLID